jgi:hypothetical protein
MEADRVEAPANASSWAPGWVRQLAGFARSWSGASSLDPLIRLRARPRSRWSSSGVPVVVSQLSRQGWLVYRRGVVEIIDRVGLEGATCECYEVIRDEFARLVGPPLPRARKARAGAKSG